MTAMQENDFKPSWWLRSPHIQTLLPFIFRRRAKLDLQCQQLDLEDGDFLDLNWSKKTQGKIVLVIHGLEGSLDSHYSSGLMQTLEQQGYRPVFMHFRGCSGRVNRLARSYHSGDTADIAAVVKHITEQTGQPVYAAIGFSLGANALLKWLGETGDDNPLHKAIAVSVPFQYDDAVERLDKGFSKFYRDYLLHSLCKNYRRKFSVMPAQLDVDLKKIKTLWQFDDEITAPLHGFDNAKHYYKEPSCRQFLKNIQVNTQIIHAGDDPFMYRKSAPQPDELSQSVKLHLLKHGGHVGFVYWRLSLPFRLRYWHEEKICEFLED